MASGRPARAGRLDRVSVYRLNWRPALAEIVGDGRPWAVLMISPGRACLMRQRSGCTVIDDMDHRDIAVEGATFEELPRLASVFGRAFVTEPMMHWPLGDHGDLAERFTRCFGYFLEKSIPRGMVRQAGDSIAVAVWDPPERATPWDNHPWNQPRIRMLADDGGARYEAFWDWVYSHTPREPLWQLDSVAVDPAHQRHGFGRALIADGLDRARASGVGAFLSTGTPDNVTIYGRAGFRVVDHDVYEKGGPHVWFMRWDP